MGTEAKPFLKWAGGKGQLLSQLSEHFPDRISREPFTYIEPFVGGGAMLFYMLQRFDNIKKVIINDVNEDLILSYRIIKKDVEALICKLAGMEKDYLNIADQDGRKNLFYEIRDRYNQHVGDSVERVSQLLFLNKTCFNGLYRVNKKGLFNVPFGKYSNPVVCNADVLKADSQRLQNANVEICQGDYAQTLPFVDGLTFFYLVGNTFHYPFADIFGLHFERANIPFVLLTFPIDYIPNSVKVVFHKVINVVIFNKVNSSIPVSWITIKAMVASIVIKFKRNSCF